MIDDVEVLMKKFNDVIMRNPSLQEDLKDFNRTVQIEFSDDASLCNMRLVNGQVAFLCDGPVEGAERPDLRIIMDTVILKGIIEKTVDPAEAYFNDRIQIIGSIFDKLMLNRVLSG